MNLITETVIRQAVLIGLREKREVGNLANANHLIEDDVIQNAESFC